VTIAPLIAQHYPELNKAQRDIVGHIEGPLLVIAGPGSGKTYSIVLRALNLLLLEKAQPRQLVLCTFTEKAAFEMRDRLAAAARRVGYAGDLSELTVSTIHGFCNRVLTQHRHRTELGHSFETLDELTQLLFIFEHFEEIIRVAVNDLFLFRWKTRWTAIEGAQGYFDKITEELVDPQQLIGSRPTRGEIKTRAIAIMLRYQPRQWGSSDLTLARPIEMSGVSNELAGICLTGAGRTRFNRFGKSSTMWERPWSVSSTDKSSTKQ
jgi:superfamily I DNA/RNA helicase